MCLDAVPACGDTGPELLYEGVCIVSAVLGPAVRLVVDVEAGVDVCTGGFIRYGGVDRQKRHSRQAVVRIDKEHSISWGKTVHCIRARVDLFCPITSGGPVLSDILVRGHHGAAARVTPDDDLVDTGLISQVGHAGCDVTHHRLEVEVVHLAGLALGVVEAEGRVSADREFGAGVEGGVVLLGVHDQNSDLGLCWVFAGDGVE